MSSRTRSTRRSAPPPVTRVSAEIDRLRPRLVLVDCFGTLVHRGVPSGRVREIAAQELADALGGVVPADEIVRRRRALERELSRELSSPGHPRDHRLPDLALALHERLGPIDLPDAGAFRELFCSVELATEASIARPNDAMVALLARLDDQVRVAVVSDTNLTTPLLGELLRSQGIDAVVDEVFASSDAGETKRSGRLYELVLRSTGVDPTEAIMIGDNPLSDGERAERSEISTQLVASGRWDGVKDASSEAIRRDVTSRLREVVAPVAEDDVFPELALSLWLFVARLDAALRRKGATEALFLAREGLFLKGLFDRLQTSRSHLARPPIESSYLLTSRKSTFLPALVAPDTQLRSLLERQPGMTRCDLADLLGVPVDEPAGTAVRDELVEERDLDALLDGAPFVDALISRRETQSALLRELVDEATGESGPVHVVDVGWKGTVRDQLAAVLVGRPVYAHLLGLTSAELVPDLDLKTGHLFSNQPERSPHYQVFSHFKELYELLLAADHGSTSAYRRDEAGRVAAILDDDQVERRCHVERIDPFQRACTRRFTVVLQVLGAVRGIPPWLEELTARHHARMVYRPRVAELDFVEALVQYENFGARSVKVLGKGSSISGPWPSLRRHVSGGGWPPLRMRRAGSDWQRQPYGLAKMLQLRRGALR